jgi:hypothetical protein
LANSKTNRYQPSDVITGVAEHEPGEPLPKLMTKSPPVTGHAVLTALAAGRSWCGSLSKFTGALDMLVDGSVPMGAVSVSSVTSRQLVASRALPGWPMRRRRAVAPQTKRQVPAPATAASAASRVSQLAPDSCLRCC